MLRDNRQPCLWPVLSDVVIGFAAEVLHADDGFFELVRSPEKLLLHDKPKKAAEPVVARKTRAGEDLLQLGADKLRI